MTRLCALRAGALALACAASIAGLAACSGSSAGLRVSAAASLQRAFTRYAAQTAGAPAHLSFAGSDALAAQIEAGARPDVFASASTVLPQRLFARRLVERPIVFTSNELVLAVAARSPLTSLAQAASPGVTLAVGTPTVPVGAYTAKVLARAPAALRSALERNIRDREPDVAGIVGKLAAGAVQAGFVYITDVRATGGQLRAIAVPAALRPQVAYAAAVVRGGSQTADARRFVAGLLAGRGQADLREAGFRPFAHP